MEHDHLRVNYPGDSDWYFVSALVGPIGISFRGVSLDYSRFTDANLRQLNVVSGFLMKNACSFSIRDVTFLRPGDE